MRDFNVLSLSMHKLTNNTNCMRNIRTSYSQVQQTPNQFLIRFDIVELLSTFCTFIIILLDGNICRFGTKQSCCSSSSVCFRWHIIIPFLSCHFNPRNYLKPRSLISNSKYVDYDIFCTLSST